MRSYKLLLIGLCFVLATWLMGCGAADASGTGTQPFEKHLISYPEDYSLDDGAASYDSEGDHFDSPYWKPLDVYNMKSTATLTIIPEFETYQQSTEYSCGAGTELMVLKHYGVTDYDEKDIITGACISSETGVGVDGMETFFKGIGWNVERSVPGKKTFDWETDDNATATFTKWVQDNLKEGTPIMVDWIDWGGHWQVIIGYDTMGTDNFGDDVLIMADPYDTSDHYQDGYFTVPAERFFYMWREGSDLGTDIQPWLIAKPQ